MFINIFMNIIYNILFNLDFLANGLAWHSCREGCSDCSCVAVRRADFAEDFFLTCTVDDFFSDEFFCIFFLVYAVDYYYHLALICFSPAPSEMIDGALHFYLFLDLTMV